jgi:hypothetical protein
MAIGEEGEGDNRCNDGSLAYVPRDDLGYPPHHQGANYRHAQGTTQLLEWKLVRIVRIEGKRGEGCEEKRMKGQNSPSAMSIIHRSHASA